MGPRGAGEEGKGRTGRAWEEQESGRRRGKEAPASPTWRPGLRRPSTAG